MNKELEMLHRFIFSYYRSNIIYDASLKITFSYAMLYIKIFKGNIWKWKYVKMEHSFQPAPVLGCKCIAPGNYVHYELRTSHMPLCKNYSWISSNCLPVMDALYITFRQRNSRYARKLLLRCISKNLRDVIN